MCYKNICQISCENKRGGRSSEGVARGWKGEGVSPHLPVTDTNRADLRVLSPSGIYPTLLFTYHFICFVPISPYREFLCLHAPDACPRKAATCERFTAAITQFSSERSAFIGLFGNKLRKS